MVYCNNYFCFSGKSSSLKHPYIRRGHSKGDCGNADESRWTALKGLGRFSRSPEFVFQLDPRSVLTKITCLYGDDQLRRHFTNLPAYIQELLTKERGRDGERDAAEAESNANDTNKDGSADSEQAARTEA
jgi:hypothetical protein